MNQPGKKKTFARKSCVVATQLALAMMAVNAQAQQGERIEVTGSRIPLQQNVESHSPVTVISAEDIKVEGSRSVESILNNLPQVFADQNGTVSNAASGTATVNLRGLGPDRTLVLMNGRRLPMGSVSTVAPDLNQIPASLVKRIEILTGGAGAVYGSDAIAGVVNFIMNDKFEGVQIDLNYSFYNHQQNNPRGVADLVATRARTNPREFVVPGDKSRDGDIGDIGITMGSNFHNGKGNATLFFGYKDQKTLLQSERDFSSCALGGGANFTCGGSGTNATGRFQRVGSASVFTITDAAGTARAFNNSLDQYNYAPTNFYQRPDERYSFSAFANYDINSKVKAYGEFNFHDDLSIAQVAPGGIFGALVTLQGNNPLLSNSLRTALGLTNSPTSSAEVVINRRNVEGGGRQSELRHTSFREVVGLKGEVAKWNYDVFAQAAKVIYSQVQQNYFLNERISRALDVVNVNGVPTCRSVQDGSDPNCVPYNVFSLGGITAAQLNYIQAPGFQKGSTQQSIYGAHLSSDLGDYGLRLPAAKSGIAVAMGAERRTEKLDLDSDVAVTTGALSGSGGPTPPLHGKYTVNEFFGEARVPLIENKRMAEDLSVSGSIRRSNYSTGVSTNTYGLGVDWSPTKAAKVRGSYQNAVRAPNLVELFQAQGNNLFDMDFDPCAGPTPAATRAQCALTGVTAAQYGLISDSPAGQYNYLQGGNPLLEPEKAKTFTVGVVLTPTRNLSATVDYFDIKVDKTISNLDPSTIISLCLSSGQYCNLITRDRTGSLWLLDDGRVTATNQNLGGTATSGVDVAVNYNHPIGRMGTLGVNFVGTWLRTLEIEEVKGQGIYDCVGYYANNKCGNPNPEWRHKLRLTWGTPWLFDAAVTWRYIGEVEHQGLSSNPLLTAAVNATDRTLASQNYIDIAGSVAVTRWLTLRGGINNLLDRDPPLTSSLPTGFGNGNTFPGVYDTLGRKVFVTATMKF